ncbi:4'-phosphopantetheinyl transferase superfamily protein, partial [Pseudomonas aeruginosa]|uniref:4'-phosphopantetheinyl transferase superfamily protein n=1 Tax=Pseudomonas aeruginosa TaxID=287 RepID=UPI003D18818C
MKRTAKSGKRSRWRAAQIPSGTEVSRINTSAAPASSSVAGRKFSISSSTGRWLANAVFSLGEHAEMDAVHPDQQLEMFWRIWTRKEAIVKQ